ncbi:MAG TPA: type II secretion system F family protein [Candidatus Paceibacterota bacterium]|jgi:type IV pilus assembly protein PilC|nr:type II secretion system F family protein [Candidatus Paceibacterota bacterium]
MAVFEYKAIDQDGSVREGTIDAVNVDLAIGALQRRGLVISAIDEAKAKSGGLDFHINFFDRITNEDIVMLSRQITSLFEAQVSALRAFRLLASEARTPKLAARLTEIGNDIQSGTTISAALGKHPDVFSNFYVNMVKAGEESGKLDETFSFLADYLDRNYEITSKTRNALIYPAFIMATFVGVMVLMLTVIIPNLSGMLTQVNQGIPLYTQVIINFSNFLVKYWLLLAIIVVAAGFFLYRYSKTATGAEVLSRAKMQTPVVGHVFKQLYLSRIADNLATMLGSGVQILRALEITGTVVGDPTYEKILAKAAEDVKSGLPVSEALRKYPEMPGIMIAMMKIGEETGNMGSILVTIAKFYRREVNNSVDTLVSLIEPLMIVALAVGVGFLLASVLIPIYNLASSF